MLSSIISSHASNNDSSPGRRVRYRSSDALITASKSFSLDFYVTHLAAWGRWGKGARSLQALTLVERLHRHDGPFILVGDLNAVPTAPELRPLISAEIFRMCGDDLICTHRFMRQRIDYIFADPGWTTTSSQVIEIGPSDHWPVLVELQRSS